MDYLAADFSHRWREYVGFHNKFRGTSLDEGNPLGLDEVHDRVDDLGAIIVCLNSSLYVQKGTKHESRGLLIPQQIADIDAKLQAIPRERLKSAIRIALVHHHPLLIPPLVEADREYDAVERSGYLLNLLHKYGFHLLLHGHKHLPLTFTEDIRVAHERTSESPLVVIAGGSAASSGRPDATPNTYNTITVKWNEEVGQFRVRDKATFFL